METLITSDCNHIGLYYDIDLGVIMKSGDTFINMNEHYLKIQGVESRLENLKSIHQTPPFINLNDSFINLKLVLTTLPNNVNDVNEFIKTIDLISTPTLRFMQAIKHVTFTVTDLTDLDQYRAIEQEMKNFRKFVQKHWKPFFDIPFDIWISKLTKYDE